MDRTVGKEGTQKDLVRPPIHKDTILKLNRIYFKMLRMRYSKTQYNIDEDDMWFLEAWWMHVYANFQPRKEYIEATYHKLTDGTLDKVEEALDREKERVENL